MKFIHLSDLHLGKRVNEFSMLEDQRYILGQILDIIREEQPDAVLVAGDVYDKSVPSAEATQLFDQFLVSLVAARTPVYIISGNHDSAERLAFGGRIMQASQVYLSPVYDGRVEPLTLEDEHGPVDLWLLPFLKPSHVRRFYPEEELDSYNAAMALAIREMKVDPSRRNILMTHQFVAGAEQCESEEVTVGGTDGVAVELFRDFDYVALGHLHGPQKVGRETVRYCGSPLKYSFSEADQEKSVTLVELGAKGDVTVSTRPLTPLHEMVRLCGTFAQLSDPAFGDNARHGEDYVQITLTDQDDVPDAMQELRKLYHNLMKLTYDNARTRNQQSLLDHTAQVKRDPLDLLTEFFTIQNGQDMSDEQLEYARRLMETLKEEQA